jgi:hypothetical protein
MIRLSIHLGSVGAPVNSMHAGAWRQRKTNAKISTWAADLAAILAAEWLTDASRRRA